METIVTIFDPKGQPLGQLDNPNVVRSWTLYGYGRAEFDVPIGSTKATGDLLNYGNLVLVQHDRAGDWGGVLWPDPVGHQWGRIGIGVTVYGYESVLKRRVSMLQAQGEDLGGIFAALMAEANQLQDSRITVGSTSGLQITLNEDFRYRYTYDILSDWVKDGQAEWGLEPVLQDGQLYFEANIWPTFGRGQFHDVALVEGVNIQWSGEAIMQEQGAIYNDIRLVGAAAKKGDRPFIPQRDDASRNQHGLSQAIITAQKTEFSEREAINVLRFYRNPRRTFDIAAIDVALPTGRTFDYLGTGDYLWLHMPSVGFEGTHSIIRVIGKAFDDATGIMELTVDEVWS